MSSEEKYLNDPVFHRIVDSLRTLLTEHHVTPSEVREAAMLACCLHEREHTMIAPLARWRSV